MTKKTLMIDDDPVLVKIVSDILSGAGYEFHSAGSGAAGVEKAKALHPHLVILDVNLPDMLGYEVCQLIRGGSTTKDIPILMMTGHYAQSSDKVRGLDAGADDYLVKPFDTDVLLARVDAILRRSYPDG